MKPKPNTAKPNAGKPPSKPARTKRLGAFGMNSRRKNQVDEDPAPVTTAKPKPKLKKLLSDDKRARGIRFRMGILCAVLAFGLGLVRIDVDPERGVYEWIHRNGPRRAELMQNAPQLTVGEVVDARSLRIPVRTALELRHANPNAITHQLRPLLAGGELGVTIGSIAEGERGFLLLLGYSHQVASVIEMVRLFEEGTGDPAENGKSHDDWRTRFEQRLEALERRF